MERKTENLDVLAVGSQVQNLKLRFISKLLFFCALLNLLAELSLQKKFWFSHETAYLESISYMYIGFFWTKDRLRSQLALNIDQTIKNDHRLTKKENLWTEHLVY